MFVLISPAAAAKPAPSPSPAVEAAAPEAVPPPQPSTPPTAAPPGVWLSRFFQHLMHFSIHSVVTSVFM